MANRKKGAQNRQAGHRTHAARRLRSSPRCREISDRGINTAADFTAFMSALVSDVIDGTISAGIANAAVNAGGKMLKCVELTMKYGTPGATGRRVLHLTEGQQTPAAGSTPAAESEAEHSVIGCNG